MLYEDLEDRDVDPQSHPPPAPKFSPLPKGRKLTRDECAAALAERVAAGTITATDASAILKMFGEST